LIVASDLTLIECDRVLIRAAALKALPEGEVAERRAQLVDASAEWHILRVSAEIVDRSRQPFPGEPIRTLDALHLASALTARTALTELQLLTLDERIRAAARALSIPVQPVQSV